MRRIGFVLCAVTLAAGCEAIDAAGSELPGCEIRESSDGDRVMECPLAAIGTSDTEVEGSLHRQSYAVGGCTQTSGCDPCGCWVFRYKNGGACVYYYDYFARCAGGW